MLRKQQHYGRSLLHALGEQNRSQVKVIQQHLLCRKCVCGQRVWLTCVVVHSMTIAITLIYMANMFMRELWRRLSPSH